MHRLDWIREKDGDVVTYRAAAFGYVSEIQLRDSPGSGWSRCAAAVLPEGGGPNAVTWQDFASLGVAQEYCERETWTLAVEQYRNTQTLRGLRIRLMQRLDAGVDPQADADALFLLDYLRAEETRERGLDLNREYDQARRVLDDAEPGTDQHAAAVRVSQRARTTLERFLFSERKYFLKLED